MSSPGRRRFTALAAQSDHVPAAARRRRHSADRGHRLAVVAQVIVPPSWNSPSDPTVSGAVPRFSVIGALLRMGFRCHTFSAVSFGVTFRCSPQRQQSYDVSVRNVVSGAAARAGEALSPIDRLPLPGCRRFQLK